MLTGNGSPEKAAQIALLSDPLHSFNRAATLSRVAKARILCRGNFLGFRMARRFLAPALLALVLAAGPAMADELVVVEAHGGIHLAPGATIDGAKTLSLEDGQTLTLLASDGEVLTLEGPYAGTPQSGVKNSGADLRTAIAALATARAARASEVGVVRGENDVRLPDPWVVDVTHPGTSCVEPGAPVVLWRQGSLDAVDVTFSPADQSWHEHGTWPAGTDRVALPASMPLRDRTDYVVNLGRRFAPVTIRLIPASVNNDAMRAGYMNAMGCGNQVGALLALYQK
jgi:hypothetical protein